MNKTTLLILAAGAVAGYVFADKLVVHPGFSHIAKIVQGS